MATIATFKVPTVHNEPNKHYAKGSPDRKSLESALEALSKRVPLEVPLVVGGKQIKTTAQDPQPNPSAHATIVANASRAGSSEVQAAITAALAAKPAWETLTFADRATIFLKAADLIGGKYRYEIMAATMLGQGKNAWQAEIDAAAELADFLRFNVTYAQDLYAAQPTHNAPGVWNRVEYRALEGFVYAISPFNFTAIGGNLPAAPALMGNVVIWKPSPAAVASNWLVYQALLEAGLPANVVQFIPGDAEEVTKVALEHKDFAALHYTGSTAVFRHLYGRIGAGIADGRYRGYPRVVGETGGKNFHLVHRSADIDNAVQHTVRAAFEFQGQKCSACSRAYVPSEIAPKFIEKLVTAVKDLKVGPPTDFANFVGPVIHQRSFDKLKGAIDAAKSDPGCEILVGGTADDSKGFFVQPTVIKVNRPDHDLLKTELFGPVLAVYEYDGGNQQNSAEAFEKICAVVDSTSEYALTGAVFATDREAVRFAEDKLRHAAGNFYLNCKCTGAVVGQQPFGGARASGTNDKAGSASLLSRFVSMRTVKEEFSAMTEGSWAYPSNEV